MFAKHRNPVRTGICNWTFCSILQPGGLIQHPTPYPKSEGHNASCGQASCQDAEEGLMQHVMRLCCCAEQEVRRLHLQHMSGAHPTWTVIRSSGAHSPCICTASLRRTHWLLGARLRTSCLFTLPQHQAFALEPISRHDCAQIDTCLTQHMHM